MYKCILALHVKKEMTELEINQIKSLKNLTPGEFHIVSDKLTLSDTAVSHNRLIELLEDEIRQKPKVKNIVGFGA